MAGETTSLLSLATLCLLLIFGCYGEGDNLLALPCHPLPSFLIEMNSLPSPKDPDKLADDSSPVERIKDASNYLRGTLAQSLADDLTGALADDDAQLIKFHGVYQQDDRDRRSIRAEKKLEPAYSFMARLRTPGGFITARQWLTLDRIASEMAKGGGGGGIRLTSRQTVQLHGILKRDLKSAVQTYGRAMLDSIAACGDVNRNVMCSPNPHRSPTHGEIYKLADEISRRLLPRSRAYFEIFLDEKPVFQTEEPLYGRHYLPRKFKIAIAIPPQNDTDIFSNDIGLIAIVNKGKLKGFNIAVGGGLGTTHGDARTYPRLGDVIGFCGKEKIADAAFHLAAIQRDYGNRTDRKLARFKYTVERLGKSAVRAELESRLGFSLEKARPFIFTGSGDELGWKKSGDEKWHLTILIESGRVRDFPGRPLMSALCEIAATDCCHFRATGNQNLILSGVGESGKARIDGILARHKIGDGSELSGLRRNAMACVALPTCPLAMAESERYLPKLLARLEPILSANGLADDAILIRMTGCPNACARPYLGEIGLVGKSPGRYNLYLGAAFDGARLNQLYRENLDEEGIVQALSPIFSDYAANRREGERFGDFSLRAGYPDNN